MIQLQALSKKFNKKVIFEDVTLVFEPNKSYALVGQSGSGKSTLLNAIGRLEKPTSGAITLDNKNIWDIKEKTFFKRYLGYVFQNYALLDHQTVLDNLKIVNRDRAQIKAVLEQVGLNQSYLKAKIFELSGGQAQRVAIARMALKEKKVILADEPTGALDDKTGSEIIDILLGMVSANTYVIIATHDPKVYSRVDEVIDITQL
ncbi:ATP-binding cassette domain-containing protein [Leuconostoc lactis]|uniref:ATP-binding cassette domain-containing protein n=1 Tax=Leuconostoc lactis TaxID=1246 RepID=A0AAP9ECW1_LEULA|nr:MULTISPECIES: ATP-binding cassette domain-containing protein [Leuconostoc]MBU7537833.1 ATP-binding cassette domain-containing protein [Leuconostoc lactis]MCC2744223.1 ATP-binding cassette domain-containing protein [Leuconostoc lactis]MCC2754450.1 ATP-binding cassette domain-containing protein [Leuconostoc lactis]MCT3055257.1 ATP-binding cassette domain-containing protein [Leuconostoc citreum]MCT3063292.1 ATP-binding cassette domain-containing protein [Leuconostoc citreum]